MIPAPFDFQKAASLGADYPGALLALDAEIVVQSSSGKRNIIAAEFFVDFYENALEFNELVVEVRIAKSACNQNLCNFKFPNLASIFPIVGCAVALTKNGNECSEVHIGYSGVAPTAFRGFSIESALSGKSLTADSIAVAVDSATEDHDVLSDQSASKEYRRHLAKVFAARALAQLA